MPAYNNLEEARQAAIKDLMACSYITEISLRFLLETGELRWATFNRYGSLVAVTAKPL